MTALVMLPGNDVRRPSFRTAGCGAGVEIQHRSAKGPHVTTRLLIWPRRCWRKHRRVSRWRACRWAASLQWRFFGKPLTASSAFALMDTNPRAETVEMRAAREPQIRAVRQGGLAVVMREEMKPNYLADGPRRAEILDLCMDMAAALGPDVFISQSRALQTRPDQQETLRANQKSPALVLCGEDDRPCPVERHELMHALIPGSHLEIVRGAGHLPTLEQPGLTNDALTRWLELDR